MRIWPFLLAPFVIAGYFFFERHMSSLAVTSSVIPNEATGKVWEITFRGGATRYVEFVDYVIFNAPIVAGPLIILVGVGLFVFTKHSRKANT